MPSVYARSAASSSVWGGRKTHGAGRIQPQQVPFRVIHDQGVIPLEGPRRARTLGAKTQETMQTQPAGS